MSAINFNIVKRAPQGGARAGTILDGRFDEYRAGFLRDYYGN